MPILRSWQAGDAVAATGSDSSSLRVALDATPLLGARSGVGVFTTCALNALAARDDLDVVAFAVSWRRRHGIVELLPAAVTRVDLPMPARPLHLAWPRLPSPAIEWWTGRLDVVHGTNFIVPPARHAARVVTVHDLSVVRFPELCDRGTRYFPALVRRAVQRGAFVHTPSEFVAQEVIEFFGADPDRVRAVYHGAPPIGPPIEDGDDGATPAAAQRERFILAIGTVEPRKDYPTLVRAFDALAICHPELRLVIVGADGWGVEALDAAIVAAHHGDRIVRRGWLSDAQRDELMRRASVLAYPSIYEGFGLPPIEAMAAGIPVVATQAGALPEILGGGAELVPVGDSDALASALTTLLDDEAARDALVARGRRRAASFSWQACAQGLTDLYRSAHAASR